MIAPPGFDARFSAGSRRYVYRIDDGTAANLFRRGYVLRHRGELDVIAMDDAARQLVGLQDFAAYCKPREGATTIRRLITFAWRRPTIGPDAGLVTGIIRSDAFCHNMVRSLVGSIIKVGEGRWLVDRPREILASGDRALAAAVVAAHGLTLEEVSYPPPPFGAERATQIRAMRE
jgi:tRNA pseudouridine38-40 synthase